MRMKFVECKSRNTARRHCPWAAKIMAVTGGYMCFESVDDYYRAINQR